MNLNNRFNIYQTKPYLTIDEVQTIEFAEIYPSRYKTSLYRLASYTVILALLVGNALFSTAVAGTTCHPLVIPTTVTLSSEGSSSYNLADGQLGGSAANDYATLELYNLEMGSFDLGAGVNLNYSSCNQCVLLFQDSTDGVLSKIFFQDQGVLELLAAPGADPMPLELHNLRLIEVTLDPKSFESTPVPDGECYIGVNDVIFINGFEN